MSAAKASVSSLPVDDKRRAHEPTMEEILASIRRIISEDQQTRGEELGFEPEEGYNPDQPMEPQHGLPGEPSPSRDTGWIAQPQAAEDRQENILRKLRASSEAQSRGSFRQAAEILEAAERELTPLKAPGADMRGMPDAHPVLPDARHVPPLVSDTTAAAIAAQFESLAASRLFGEEGRIDEIVSQLMRPMLREWLEDNLPGIVEKLVRAEIERVARGGRN